MLENTDFIEVDREMLQMLGYKNSFAEKKDKFGNVKVDEHGRPKLEDTRKDFNNAIRSLRKSSVLAEGTHFVVQKSTNEAKTKHGAGGHNKLSLFVHKDVLQEWIKTNAIKQNTKKQTNNGLVYFIHMKNNRKVFKIGFTTDLKARLQDLQVAHPYLLQVYATIENVPKKMETELHHFFEKKHVRGEWFAITPKMIDSVKKRKFENEN